MEEMKLPMNRNNIGLVERKLPCVLNSEKTGDELMIVDVTTLVGVIGFEDVF